MLRGNSAILVWYDRMLPDNYVLSFLEDKKDKSMFDTSKIPDIWDNLYYDLITHRFGSLGTISISIFEHSLFLDRNRNTRPCDQKFQTDMNRKSLVERGKHHEDCLNICIYIYAHCIYVYKRTYINTNAHINKTYTFKNLVLIFPGSSVRQLPNSPKRPLGGDIWDPSR